MQKHYKVFLISLFFIIFFFSTFLFKFFLIKKRKNDPSYNIKTVFQKENKLPKKYLEEILNFSSKKKINIYDFDLKKAKELLKKSPLIKNAFVKKIKPDGIFVDYEIRKPIASILDFENVLMDEKGFIFPKFPFFKNKENFVSIYLEERDLLKREKFFEKPILSKKVILALKILKIFKDKNLLILKRIDVSKAFYENLGKREIVLKLEHFYKNKKVLAFFPIILRLNSEKYKLQLDNYFSLMEKIMGDYKKQIIKMQFDSKILKFSEKCIDMRISQMAFIDIDQ